MSPKGSLFELPVGKTYQYLYIRTYEKAYTFGIQECNFCEPTTCLWVVFPAKWNNFPCRISGSTVLSSSRVEIGGSFIHVHCYICFAYSCVNSLFRYICIEAGYVH